MGTGRPLVSVIIPTYNRSAWLRAAVQSVLAQTWKSLEIVVIDDGSTDSTEETVANMGDRVLYVRQENRGPATARNRGLEMARGDWIAFLDSDDLWLPDKLARCMDRIRTDPDAVFVFHPNIEIDDAGRRVHGRSKRAAEGDVLSRLFCHCFVHTSTVLIRRDVLETTGGFDPGLEVCEDYQLWLKVAARHPFTLVRRPLALRRLHKRRLSKSLMHRNMILRAEMLERFYHDHQEHEGLHRRQARKRLARVFRSAAKANLRARRYADAHALLLRSRTYRPFSLQTTMLLARTAFRRDSVTDGSSRLLKPVKELSA